MEQLSTLDSRKAQIVELKYFGGLNYDEIAEVLKISRITVRRDWEFAKVWLYKELRSSPRRYDTLLKPSGWMAYDAGALPDD